MLAATPQRRQRRAIPPIPDSAENDATTANMRTWGYLALMRAGKLARHERQCRGCADPDGPGYCGGAMTLAVSCDEASDAAQHWQARRDTAPQLEPEPLTTLF